MPQEVPQEIYDGITAQRAARYRRALRPEVNAKLFFEITNLEEADQTEPAEEDEVSRLLSGYNPDGDESDHLAVEHQLRRLGCLTRH